MNNLFSKVVFYVGIIFFINIQCAEEMKGVLINGKDINKCIPPNRTVKYRTDENNIVLKFENVNFTIGSLRINNIEELKRAKNQLHENKDKLASITSPILTMNCGVTIRHNAAYVESSKYTTMEAGSEILISRTLLISPKMKLISTVFKINSCFLTIKKLTIKSKVLDSLIKKITFIFNTDDDSFCALEGELDFRNNVTNPWLVAMGARKARITFSDKAFDYKK